MRNADQEALCGGKVQLWRVAARWALSCLLLLAFGCRHAPQPAYPIGLYSVPKSDLKTVEDAGFNLVTGPAEKEYLDAAQAAWLKVLASPGTSAGPEFSETRAQQVVTRFDRHPALWAWYLVDEPDLNQVHPEDVKRAHRFLKQLSARKPTALVIYQGGEALHYANLADVTMIDRYPIPWLPLANFPQHVRMVRLALGKQKPMIAVIQAFDWTYYPKLRPTEDAMRPPVYEELRCMTYCALARGATGLFYYCYNDSSWKLTEHPAVWNALKTVVAEVKDHLPLFQAEHVWWPYDHEFPDANTGFNSALESSVIPALLRVKEGNHAIAPGDYLLAVNNTDREFRYRITAPPGMTGITPVVGEDRLADLVGGWLEDNFGPFDAHIYGPIRGSTRRNR